MQEGKVFSQAYEADGTLVDALVDCKLLHKVAEYAQHQQHT